MSSFDKDSHLNMQYCCGSRQKIMTFIVFRKHVTGSTCSTSCSGDPSCHFLTHYLNIGVHGFKK